MPGLPYRYAPVVRELGLPFLERDFLEFYFCFKVLTYVDTSIANAYAFVNTFYAFLVLSTW